MPISLRELMEDVPNDLEGRIRAEYRRTNNRIREALRIETALTLNPYSKQHVSRKRRIVSIPIRFEYGYHIPFDSIPISTDSGDLSKLFEYLELFNRVLETVKKLKCVKSKYAKEIAAAESLRLDDNAIGNIEEFCKTIIEILKRQDLVKEMYKHLISTKNDREIHDDILGIYRYGRVDQDGNICLIRPIIEIYWGAIGLFSKFLNCDPVSLSTVIIVHELAHAYTHLGADIEGFRWPTYAFLEADISLKEGLAQYYTHRVLERLSKSTDSHFLTVLCVFRQLMEHQPCQYKVHKNWTGSGNHQKVNQESVRLAMLEARRKENGSFQEFEKGLHRATEGLQVRELLVT